MLISNYLAANSGKLSFKKNIVIDVDSEFHVDGCTCEEPNNKCSCTLHAIPIRGHFTKQHGYTHSELLNVEQRKGEGEMAQLDWMAEAQTDLKPGEAALSVVTSGDIDYVVIHIYVVSKLWKRSANGKFSNPVFVLLQKQGKKTLYNITSMIEVRESYYQDSCIGGKVALALCMGGNNFLPKLHNITHSKVLN